jgi:HD-like signal output (HDOD) protein
VHRAAHDLDALTRSDHAVVGSMVARNWKLAAVVVDAIRLQNRPADAAAAGEPVAILTTLLAAARRGLDIDRAAWTAWQPMAGDLLALDENEVEALRLEARGG